MSKRKDALGRQLQALRNLENKIPRKELPLGFFRACDNVGVTVGENCPLLQEVYFIGDLANRCVIAVSGFACKKKD